MDYCWTPSTGCRGDFAVAAVPLPDDVRGSVDDSVGVAAGDDLAGVGVDVAIDVAVGAAVDAAADVVYGQAMDVCVHCSGAPAAMVAYVPVLVVTTRLYFHPHQPYRSDGSCTGCTDYGEHSRATGVNLTASVLMGSLSQVYLMLVDCYPRCWCCFLRSNFVPVPVEFERELETPVEESLQPRLPLAEVL